jgi:hypothetical protein
MKTSRNEEGKVWKNKLYSVDNLRGNVEILFMLGKCHFNVRIVQNTMVEITVT